MKATIQELRAKHWGKKAAFAGCEIYRAKALVFTGSREGSEPLRVVNPLALALARVNFDNACSLRNRTRLYAASVEVKRDTLREAHAQMQRANENLKAAYGWGDQ